MSLSAQLSPGGWTEALAVGVPPLIPGDIGDVLSCSSNFIVYSSDALHATGLPRESFAGIQATSDRLELEYAESISLPASTMCVVGFGGGSAIDLGKYIAHKHHVPFVAVPSHLGCNAFATAYCCMRDTGSFVTIPTGIPSAVILDWTFIQRYGRSSLLGMSDVLAIATSSFDWNLAISVGQDVDQSVYIDSCRLLDQAISLIVESDPIGSRLGAILECIVHSAAMSNRFGSGRPVSGSEHVFAKRLEMNSRVPHGVAVGIGIVVMASLQCNPLLDKCVGLFSALGTLRSQRFVTFQDVFSSVYGLTPRPGRVTILDYIHSDLRDKEFVRRVVESSLSACGALWD